MHVTLTCAKWTCPPTADGVSFGKQVRIISGECRSVSNEEMVVSVLKTSISAVEMICFPTKIIATLVSRIESAPAIVEPGPEMILFGSSITEMRLETLVSVVATMICKMELIIPILQIIVPVVKIIIS